MHQDSATWQITTNRRKKNDSTSEKEVRFMPVTFYGSRRESLVRSEILTTKTMNLNVSLDVAFSPVDA